MAFVLFLMTGFYSCEKEPTVPDQNKIYASYYLDFNSTENKTTARASFYLDIPSSSNQQELELTHPAYVSYFSEPLVFESTERYYVKEFIGLKQSNFIYSNYDGNLFTNTVTMVDSLSVIVADSANTQSDFYFQVSGNPLEQNEVIDIHIESINSGMVLGSTFETISGLNIQVNTAQLISLGTGPTIIRASRRSDDPNVQGPPIGGLLQTRYSVQDTVFIY